MMYDHFLEIGDGVQVENKSYLIVLAALNLLETYKYHHLPYYKGSLIKGIDLTDGV